MDYEQDRIYKELKRKAKKAIDELKDFNNDCLTMKMFRDIKYIFTILVTKLMHRYEFVSKRVYDRFSDMCMNIDEIFDKFLGEACEPINIKTKDDIYLIREILDNKISNLIDETEKYDASKRINVYDLSERKRQSYELEKEKEEYFKLVRKYIDQLWNKYFYERLWFCIETWYDDIDHTTVNKVYNLKKNDLSDEVKDIFYKHWLCLKRRVVRKATDQRVDAIRDIHGYLLVTEDELEKIKKILMDEMEDDISLRLYKNLKK